MHDALVVGAGINGLVAAIFLARAGWSVAVLESSDEPGGACRSAALTLPGFVHDVGAAFFPFASLSPALTTLRLEEHGVVWRHPAFASCHVASHGGAVAIGPSLPSCMEVLGTDGEAWRAMTQWFQRHQAEMLPVLLGRLPPPLAAMGKIGADGLLTLASLVLATGRHASESRFVTPQAQTIFPSLAMHTDGGPDDMGSALAGYVLAMLAAGPGFPVPQGGGGAVTDALVRCLQAAGGRVYLRHHVRRVLIREGRAVAVETSNGDEWVAERAILADVAAPKLFLELLPRAQVSSRIVKKMQRFRYGFGTFKMDWALAGPVPWRNELARLAGAVHPVDSIDELARCAAEIRAGVVPKVPHLVVGQQSLCDETRAPPGRHTLYAYSHVPSQVLGGWPMHRDEYANRIEQRIEAFAPGFRQRILHRRVAMPDDLAQENANLVGGDLGGGTSALSNQLFFRPMFPYFQNRTPFRGLYLASSYAHPGPGAHGMCGYNAAMAARADVE